VRDECALASNDSVSPANILDAATVQGYMGFGERTPMHFFRQREPSWLLSGQTTSLSASAEMWNEPGRAGLGGIALFGAQLGVSREDGGVRAQRKK
jgi:hypothetical protein